MSEQSGPIQAAFKALDARRSFKMAISRECSAMTIPTILPPESWTNDQELFTPYNSIGAQGVTTMSSQLAFALLPPNDIPFFEFQPDFPADETEASILETKAGLASIERRIMNRLMASNLREGILDAMVQLDAVGDALLIFEEDFLFRTIRLDNWVVERFATGRWDRVIYRERIRPDKIPEDWKGVIAETESPTDALTVEFAYIEVRKIQAKATDDATYEVCTEFRGLVVAEDKITKGDKYIVLQWKSLPGENWGQSFVQEAIGDLRTVEGLSQSLVEGAAANSEFRWLVRPGGMTKIADINTSVNGSFVPGRAEDIEPLQLNNVVQLQITFQALDSIKKSLARKFLLQSELQPTGDRVTATQIRALAQSLEDASGGIFSTISRALQVPLVKRTIALMGDKPIETMLKRPDIKLHVKTGLETLSREIEHQKVLQLSQALVSLPEVMQRKINPETMLKSIIMSFGQDPNLWIKSDEQVAKETAAAQANATQQQANSQAIQSAGAIAEQGAGQPPA